MRSGRNEYVKIRIIYLTNLIGIYRTSIKTKIPTFQQQQKKNKKQKQKCPLYGLFQNQTLT